MMIKLKITNSDIYTGERTLMSHLGGGKINFDHYEIWIGFGMSYYLL